MLYVFHVDIGRMLSFDMTVALSSVENLKDTIERLHGIPAANIVLLASGGEMLAHSTQVSYYSAGTDTNPIFMFLSGDVKLPPILPPAEPDLDLKNQVELSLELPAVYDTVVKRAEIALRMHALAHEEERLCEHLVHEQHLQQQGWSAVVANMEDLTEEFRTRFRNFCEAFDKHLERRSSYLELLSNFSDDLSKLSRIPILPGLMPLAEADFHGFDEFLENDDVFSRSTNPQQSVLLMGTNVAGNEAAGTAGGGSGCVTGFEDVDNADDKSSTSPNKKQKLTNDSNEEKVSQTSQTSITSNATRRLNLLQWITSKENHNVLKTMSDECVQGLATFNEDVYNKLKQEVQSIIKSAEQSDVREIRGLGERLCRLEEFKYKIKSMVKDQRELATAFQQNQNRAINLRDTSILPDLCASHQSQLLVMLQNHRKIREHRSCIAKAKDELGANMHARLKRIVYIENAMSEFDNRLLFYHRCLRRAERHIHIIEQIHQTPNMYVAAVTEVMRRKIFSTEFRLWASKLAEDFDSIHSEELKRRQEFNINFEGHFLNILFPGMADMPPAFANENPLIFDTRLPNITRSDMDILTTHLPEMASQMQLPDMESVIYFFVSRSGAHQRERFEELLKQKQKRATEELKQIVSGENEKSVSIAAMIVSEKLPLNPRLSELRKDAGSATCGDESETDTETEFEQVPANNQQSVTTSTSENLKQITGISKCVATDELITQCAETLTDENSKTIKKEVTHMRSMLGAMSKLALECIHLSRSNLKAFREHCTTQNQDLQFDFQTLNDKWEVLRMQCETQEREFILQQSIKEQEIIQLKEDLNRRDLIDKEDTVQEMCAMKIKCDTLEAQLEELQNRLQVFAAEKEQAVMEARDKLINKHKTEIESLRQRFKLMTSMERSPSDLSLETNSLNENYIEKHLHDAMVSQLRSDLEAEKEKAIVAAIEMERSIWQSKIVPLNSESVMANVIILKEMLEEKERQLDQMREKDLILTKENYHLKTRLDALTNEEGNSWLKEKIDYLNRDKCRLEEELNHEKSKRLEIETSFAALRSSTYETSPSPRFKSSSSNHKLIVLEFCSKGDIVFVVWSMRYNHFMVVQDSPSLYFVHGDSLPALNLHLPQAGNESVIPLPYYAIGRVIDKEYCQARKDVNRYRVNRGSKFYRVKLAPLVSKHTNKQHERLESFSISRSISQCESHSEASPATSSTIVSSIVTTSGLSKDVVDGGAATIATSITPTVATVSLKERTISITSATEEDDEPASLLSERYRFINFTEEDEKLLADNPSVSGVSGDVTDSSNAHNINLQTTQQQQKTVITEQPTATSSKLKLDLMLASADINTTTTVATAPIAMPAITQDDSKYLVTVTPTTDVSIDDTPPQIVVTTSTTQLLTQTTNIASNTAILISPNDEQTDKCLIFIPTSIGTASEDSDEYRSLEAKDDTDFPISE